MVRFTLSLHCLMMDVQLHFSFTFILFWRKFPMALFVIGRKGWRLIFVRLSFFTRIWIKVWFNIALEIFSQIFFRLHLTGFHKRETVWLFINYRYFVIHFDLTHRVASTVYEPLIYWVFHSIVIQHKLIFFILVATLFISIFFFSTLKCSEGCFSTYKSFSWGFWLCVAISWVLWKEMIVGEDKWSSLFVVHLHGKVRIWVFG